MQNCLENHNMKPARFLSVFIIIIISFAFTCNKVNQPHEDAVAAQLFDYTGLDGCSWIIKLEDEKVLEPTNLQDFDIELKEGKKVWIKYTEQTDLASICMVGPIVSIEDIWDR